MSASLASTLRVERAAAGLSGRQVAVLAEVSPSTVSRVESGAMDPSCEVAMRLLRAVGLDERQNRLSDPAAITTARWLLADTARPARAEEWVTRWRAIGVLSDGVSQPLAVADPRTLAFRAGRAAPVTDRPGVLLLRQDRSVDEITSRLTASGVGWALTGDIAANRLAPSGVPTTPTFYVADPSTAVETLGLTYRGPREWGQPIVLIPFDGASEVGAWQDDDGLVYAAPWQVVMDCYAGGDRLPEQADAILSRVHGAA